MEELWKYLTMYLLSGFKFIFGPTLGVGYGVPLVFTALLTSFGMMTTVYVFTYFGHRLKGIVDRFKKKDRKIFSKKSRRFVKVWRKYGVKGIAFLTPVLLMPIGGAILANVLGGKRKKIIHWMWVSSLFWAFVLSTVVKYGWEAVSNFHLY
ncbi:MAG: hypothetical protein GY816_19895 [Cytophagales bacterium]|nr:hypothetical protein [Cytophagales bacterium]